MRAADGRAEHDEIERGREHRRDDALPDGAPGARHFEAVDGLYGAQVHGPVAHQADEDIFERTLPRLQVAEADVGFAEVAQQSGDPGALGLRVIGEHQVGAVGRQHHRVPCERGRHGIQPLLQMQDQLLLAELAHQLGLVLDQNDLAFVDDADAVGHLLGFLDVMRGQDDGDAGGAQIAHHLPHVLAQFDVDAGGRLVEEQDLRLVRQRFGDQHAPLHAAGQRDDLGVLLVPQRQRAQHLLDMRRVARLAEQAAAEADGAPDALEGVGVQFLRHQPDHRARRAVVLEDVVAVDRDLAGGRNQNAADDADQRRLAGAVGAEQGEDLATFDVEIDLLQRPEPGRVGLGEIFDGNDGLHRAGRDAFRAYKGRRRDAPARLSPKSPMN